MLAASSQNLYGDNLVVFIHQVTLISPSKSSSKYNAAWAIKFSSLKLWRFDDSNCPVLVLEKLRSTSTHATYIITTGRAADASFDKF